MKHPVHYTSADDTALFNEASRLCDELTPQQADVVRRLENRAQSLSVFLSRISNALANFKGQS
jgi:hypothetical protein